MKEPVAENEYIKLWIHENIMYSEYKIEEVNKEKASVMIEARLSLCNGKSYPFLADVTRVKSINREAREAFSHGKGIELMAACALVVRSPVNHLLGNFFLSVNKPTIPTKLFTSKEEALKWVSQYQ